MVNYNSGNNSNTGSIIVTNNINPPVETSGIQLINNILNRLKRGENLSQLPNNYFMQLQPNEFYYILQFAANIKLNEITNNQLKVLQNVFKNSNKYPNKTHKTNNGTRININGEKIRLKTFNNYLQRYMNIYFKEHGKNKKLTQSDIQKLRNGYRLSIFRKYMSSIKSRVPKMRRHK